MAIEFAGASGHKGYIVVDNTSGDLSFSSSDTFTIHAWVKVQYISNQNPIFSKCNSNGVGWWFGTSFSWKNALIFKMASEYNSEIRVLAYAGLSSDSAAVPNSRWSHVCVTYNGSGYASGVKMYVNSVGGQEIVYDTLTGSISNTADVTIGHCDHASWDFFDGLVADMAVYNRVLTQEEITALYNDGEFLYASDLPTASDLISYMILEDGYYSGDGYTSYPTILDVVSGNNGTMTTDLEGWFVDEHPQKMYYEEYTSTYHNAIQLSHLVPDPIPYYTVDSVGDSFQLSKHIPSSIEYSTVSFHNLIYNGSDGDAGSSIVIKYKMRARATSGPDRYHYWISDTPDFDGAGATESYIGTPHVVSKWTIYN